MRGAARRRLAAGRDAFPVGIVVRARSARACEPRRTVAGVPGLFADRGVGGFHDLLFRPDPGEYVPRLFERAVRAAVVAGIRSDDGAVDQRRRSAVAGADRVASNGERAGREEARTYLAHRDPVARAANAR